MIWRNLNNYFFSRLSNTESSDDYIWRTIKFVVVFITGLIISDNLYIHVNAELLCEYHHERFFRWNFNYFIGDLSNNCTIDVFIIIFLHMIYDNQN